MKYIILLHSPREAFPEQVAFDGRLGLATRVGTRREAWIQTEKVLRSAQCHGRRDRAPRPRSRPPCGPSQDAAASRRVQSRKGTSASRFLGRDARFSGSTRTHTYTRTHTLPQALVNLARFGNVANCCVLPCGPSRRRRRCALRRSGLVLLEAGRRAGPGGSAGLFCRARLGPRSATQPSRGPSPCRRAPRLVPASRTRTRGQSGAGPSQPACRTTTAATTGKTALEGGSIPLRFLPLFFLFVNFYLFAPRPGGVPPGQRRS